MSDDVRPEDEVMQGLFPGMRDRHQGSQYADPGEHTHEVPDRGSEHTDPLHVIVDDLQVKRAHAYTIAPEPDEKRGVQPVARDD